MLTFQFFNRKKYEGSNYLDGTNGIDLVDNAVSPGKLFKYIWQVPERAGPTENDGDCLAWAYYSDTFSVEDLYTGLVGPLVVCKKVNTYTRFVGDKGKRKKKQELRDVIMAIIFIDQSDGFVPGRLIIKRVWEAAYNVLKVKLFFTVSMNVYQI